MRCLKTAEVKFWDARKDTVYLEHKRNENISELKVDPLEKKLAQCKQKCLNHVSRIQDIRYPKNLLDYRPIGRRPGRPL